MCLAKKKWQDIFSTSIPDCDTCNAGFILPWINSGSIGWIHANTQCIQHVQCTFEIAVLSGNKFYLDQVGVG